MPRRPSATPKTNAGRLVGRIDPKTKEFIGVMGRPRGSAVKKRAFWEEEELKQRQAAAAAAEVSPNPPPLPSDVEISAELCKRVFREFVAEAWHVLEPETPFVPGWHIDAVCEHCQALEENRLRDLLICVPPRFMKSTICAILFPAWVWTRRPSSRFLYGSYSAALASEHAVKSRRVIESDWYQARWSSLFTMTGDQNVKSFYENDQTGSRISIGVGGSATGRGGRYVCCDDPHNIQEIHSDAHRKMGTDWWNQTMSTRVNPGPDSHRLVIMQRGHSDDLAGHLIDEGTYEVLKLPNRFVSAKRATTSIGWTDPRTRDGELLWNPPFDEARTAALERTLGPYGAPAQLQQEPVPIGGGIVKRSWWRYWVPSGSALLPVEVLNEKRERILVPPVELPRNLRPEEIAELKKNGERWPREEAFDEEILSLDCAFKGLQSSDYVVLQRWGRRGADCYLLEQVRGNLTFPQTLTELLNMVERNPRLGYKYVEDAANGPAVVDTLKTRVQGLVPVSPGGGKVARAQAVTFMIHGGNVYIPSPNLQGWVWDFLNEWDEFGPHGGGAHDDQVDATTHALAQLAQRPVDVPMAIL